MTRSASKVFTSALCVCRDAWGILALFVGRDAVMWPLLNTCGSASKVTMVFFFFPCSRNQMWVMLAHLHGTLKSFSIHNRMFLFGNSIQDLPSVLR
jgi:hypothetical protein